MKTKMRGLIKLPLASMAVMVFLFVVPLWLQGCAGSNTAPEAETGQVDAVTPSFVVLDAGWIAGSNNQRVNAAPQVLAWSPERSKPLWALETGILYGSLLDSRNEHVYFLEQRNASAESLQGMSLKSIDLYPPSAEWPLYLTILDSVTGEMISRQSIGEAPGANPDDGNLEPLGFYQNGLYFMRYYERDNLVSYDLQAGQFTLEVYDLCEKGYPSRAVMSAEKAAVYTLCVDHSDVMESWVSMISLDGGDQQESIPLPAFGTEDYQTGNGIVLSPNGELYVVDSDARAIAQIDFREGRVARTVNYADAFEEQEAGLFQHMAGWVADQFVQTAHAKRWYAETAVSADGRWLAVDGGLGIASGVTRTVWLIDLETLETSARLSLPDALHTMIFGEDGMLYVLLEKRGVETEVQVIAFDLASGRQFSLSIPARGWVRGIHSEAPILP